MTVNNIRTRKLPARKLLFSNAHPQPSSCAGSRYAAPFPPSKPIEFHLTYMSAPDARDPEMMKRLDAVAGRVLGQ